jgi:translocation protein SEC62
VHFFAFPQIAQRNVFEESGYYTWMYSGNMVWSNIATFLVIALVIICTLMPIWPATAKHVLWYCSVTFLIVIFSLLIMRAVAFVVMWLLGYEFWVFPRLFDESLSFQDSFVPIYTFEKGTAGQGYYRIGAVLGLIGFVYWACTQPTEFDGFIKAQKDFIDDLYSGNLLADVAHDSVAHMDRSKRVPSLEDLLKAMEADEKEKIGGSDGSGDEYVSETVSGDAGMGGEWVKLEEEVGNADSAAQGEEHGEGAGEAREELAVDSSSGHAEEAEEAEEAEWTAPDYDQEQEQHEEM